MKLIIHDLDNETNEKLRSAADQVIHADRRYAPCQGCFKCWTKHPAACELKDRLSLICRTLGAADELTIITKNQYGSFSAPVKMLLDRSIGTSTPFAAYRGGQMHHTLRYGRHTLYRVIVYGDISEAERSTLSLMAERNAINMGYREHCILFCKDAEEAGGKA